MSKQQEPKSKDKYKVLNWSDYNKSLKNRGRITIWLSEEAIEAWEYEGTREQGGKIINDYQLLHPNKIIGTFARKN